MKITRVNIPETNDDGLKEIKMEKIPSLIILAGKNGSGKTRLLNKIKRYLASKPNRQSLNDRKNQLTWKQQRIMTLEREIASIQTGNGASRPPNIEQRNNDITRLQNELNSFQQQIKFDKDLLGWDHIDVTPEAQSYSVVDYVPKRLDLVDPVNLSPISLSESAKSLDNLGMNNSQSSTLAKIQYLQDIYFSVTHPETRVNKADKEIHIRNYKKLENYVETFLGSKLTRSENNYAELFGRRLGEANFSDGQKILLQFCMAIYSQEASLKDLIIFMDKPENHLHPSVVIEVLERIKREITNGQIWIATHSIPLLAHFGEKYIWYMEDGKVSYSGKETETVLKSLLGDENEIDRISTFLSLPAQFAINQYAFECLFPPKAVSTPKGDKQVNQIRETINQIRKTGRPLKVLDYGAGKGRLLNLIFEEHSDPSELKDELDYVAFDPFDSDKAECEKVIETVYKSSGKRYYNEYNRLEEDHTKSKFDLVILCNVFHEIDPKDWLKLFGKKGEIESLIKEDGYLLIVENQIPSIGEKAYKNGFIVFNKLQFEHLFNISVSDNGFMSMENEDNKNLRAHLIPKDLISRIDNNTREEALTSLHEVALREVERLRGEEGTLKNGKLLAFWAQQYANTSLVLKEFGSMSLSSIGTPELNKGNSTQLREA